MKPRIVTTTSVFKRGYPAELALERLADIGFDALDMAFDYWVYGDDSPFLQNDYKTWAKNLRALSEKRGIPYTHSHCPGGADSGEIIGRTIEAASILGAKYMVLHPMYHDEERKLLVDAEKFIRINAENVKPWVEMAQRYGIVILSENLLDGACSDPRIISELVSYIGSENFGWCFDTGHANCFGYHPSILNECKTPPLSLHIQDNDGEDDDHLIPGDGTVDWDGFVKALSFSGYRGDCVLEAHHQCLEAPEEEKDAVLSRLLQEALILQGKMEECSHFSHD